MTIIVFGLPGSGKSFFATRLADKIGAEYLSSDKVRRDLFPQRTYAPEEKRAVYHKLLELAKNAAKQGKNTVIDATFHEREMRELFRESAPYFIEIQADEELISKRLEKERPYSEADFEVYKLVRDRFEPMTEPRLVLQSTDDNIGEMMDAALKHLNFHHDA